MSARQRMVRWGGWFLFLVMLGSWATITVGPTTRPATAAEAGEDESAPAAAGEKRPQQNFLVWVIWTSGFIGLVIFALSIYFVSTVGRLFWEFRLPMAVPPEIISECENLLEQREFKGIYDLVKADDSFFSRVLTTGIVDLPNGLPEARESMERVGEAITGEMEKKISMLAVLGTLGPMIGLLGTLKGMIASFSAIAIGGQQLKADEVAKGISEALLLTFEGVGLSVPAIYFFALFKNRVIAISTAAMLQADQFIRHFAHAGRSRSGAQAPAANPARQ
jgi:biopolymer transport protein ExbB